MSNSFVDLTALEELQLERMFPADGKSKSKGVEAGRWQCIWGTLTVSLAAGEHLEIDQR